MAGNIPTTSSSGGAKGKPRKPRPAPAPTSREDADGSPADTGDHEGGTETQVGDRTGPGAGYDDEPEQVRDKGGVS